MIYVPVEAFNFARPCLANAPSFVWIRLFVFVFLVPNPRLTVMVPLIPDRFLNDVSIFPFIASAHMAVTMVTPFSTVFLPLDVVARDLAMRWVDILGFAHTAPHLSQDIMRRAGEPSRPKGHFLGNHNLMMWFSESEKQGINMAPIARLVIVVGSGGAR